MLSFKNKLYLVTAIFFVLCCCFEFFNEVNYIFLVNLIAEIFFFTIFLKFKKTEEWSIPLFWVFFTLSGVAIFILKDIAYGPITTTLKLLGYFMLLTYVYPKQKKIKSKRIDLLIYGGLFITNVYVIFQVVKMISNFITEKYMIVLFAIYGLVLILLYMSAFRYRLWYDSRSKYFLLLASFLTAAEILGILGYFLKYEYMVYLEFFFYLFGLCFGVIAFTGENNRDSLHKLIKTGNI